MMNPSLPPYRAEHVGSLLRPPELKQAAREFNQGKLDRDALREVQDRCIREAISMQEQAGLQSITDGEFRRGSWFFGFVEAVDGLTVKPADFEFHDDQGGTAQFQGVYAEGKISRSRDIVVSDFSFVKSVTAQSATAQSATAQSATAQSPKVTIPSPSAMHFFRFHDPFDSAVYGEQEAFWSDLVDVYHREFEALAEAGCGFLQFDECPLIMMADPSLREKIAAKGVSPERLEDTYFDAMQAVLKGRPRSMRVAMHLCRGNYKGRWIASGGYDILAERLFSELDFDAYFMEYDSERAGGFEPLRFVQPGTTIVLGLLNSKSPRLESADELKRRIDEAAKFVPLDQLALSPQCGFASSAGGNPLTHEDQVSKLRRIVEVAQDVWR